ncbi:MAG: hypothetical protein QW470_07710 [Candidatus Caldarchaeum sp.]
MRAADANAVSLKFRHKRRLVLAEERVVKVEAGFRWIRYGDDVAGVELRIL